MFLYGRRMVRWMVERDGLELLCTNIADQVADFTLNAAQANNKTNYFPFQNEYIEHSHLFKKKPPRYTRPNERAKKHTRTRTRTALGWAVASHARAKSDADDCSVQLGRICAGCSCWKYAGTPTRIPYTKRARIKKLNHFVSSTLNY